MFEDTAVVQFNHRMLAYSHLGAERRSFQVLLRSVAASLGLWAYSLQLPLSATAATATSLLPMALGAQMRLGFKGRSASLRCLGIATLLLYVPTELGVAHQAGGVAVLTALLFVMHTMRLPL